MQTRGASIIVGALAVFIAGTSTITRSDGGDVGPSILDPAPGCRSSGDLLCQIGPYLRATSPTVPDPLIRIQLTDYFGDDRTGWLLIDGDPASVWSPPAWLPPGSIMVRLSFFPPVDVATVGAQLAPGSGAAAFDWSAGPAQAHQELTGTDGLVSTVLPAQKISEVMLTVTPDPDGQPLRIAGLTLRSD